MSLTHRACVLLAAVLAFASPAAGVSEPAVTSHAVALSAPVDLAIFDDAPAYPVYQLGDPGSQEDADGATKCPPRCEVHTYFVAGELNAPAVWVHNRGCADAENGKSIYRWAHEEVHHRYTVDPSTMAADRAAGVLGSAGYVRNPTARSLAGLVDANGRLGGKQMSGQFMYVVDEAGEIVIGSRAGQRMPHPTLIGGVNPTVRAAGIVDIRGGKIFSVNDASGHFKPGPGGLMEAQAAFGRLDPRIFHKNFQGYRGFGD